MNCREMILSNEYADFIFPENPITEGEEIAGNFCLNALENGYVIAHTNREQMEGRGIRFYGYYPYPKLYVPQDLRSMEASGILRLRERTATNLRGRGVIIGLIDTGIDYLNPVFQDGATRRTRILRIWDQTIQTGTAPAGLAYGSEYTAEDIDRAAASENPFSVVPSRDSESGHGTFIASIAAGREEPENGFSGAAPEAYLAVVKLKPAKAYLREFYFADGEGDIFQESDIMMGIQYLLNLQRELRMPVVIQIGVGTNNGGHTGNTPLSIFAGYAASRVGVAVVVPVGNEAGRAHHFYGDISAEGGTEDVEIEVQAGDPGFTAELWTQIGEQYSVGLISPTGDVIQGIPARLGRSDVIEFILEETVVYVDYRLVIGQSGGQLVFLRFSKPTPGIWTIRVTNNYFISGNYHMWLPVSGLSKVEPVFLRPNPDTTLTIPSASSQVISVAAYDYRNNSIYLNSGRGYTRDGAIKPDLAAPGVDIYGALPGGQFTRRTGTSIAAAHVAGAAAILLQWGIVQRNDLMLSTADVKAYLVRGADRSADMLYPNRVWGYGTLNMYRVFETLR